MRSCIAFLLVLVLGLPVTAQQPPRVQPGTLPATTAATLKVLVLQGAGAVNNIKTGTVTPPVVEVRDENDRPIEGAQVIFRLPAGGAGGLYPDQKATYTTRTNSQGQAGSIRFTPSAQPGRFNIIVTASYENRVGQATLEQTNSETEFLSEAAPKRRSRKWFYIGGAAAAGGVLAYLLLRSDAATSNVYTISPGPITIGPPR